MTPYYQDESVSIYHGDCLSLLPELSGIDMVVTDPPYELGFMGKDWDSRGVSFQPETWRLVLEACKPGAMMLSFGGTRTWHRIAVAIEDAGWEIRDTLMWLYGQGFPKSLDISKAIDKFKGEYIKGAILPSSRTTGASETGIATTFREKTATNPQTPEAQLWSGYGTALKPAFEPIILAMKPLEGTFAQNALKHGVAGLNIDGSRISYQSEQDKSSATPQGKCTAKTGALAGGTQHHGERTGFERPEQKGRFPANLILSEEAAQMLDQQSGELKSGKQAAGGHRRNTDKHRTTYMPFEGQRCEGDVLYGDSGFASRFFYCAKASKSERNKGCEELEDSLMARSGGAQQAEKLGKDEYLQSHIGLNRISKVKNDHPTVKPLALMKYLCNLLKTPTGGVLLDPFMGSGSTLIACQELGIKAVGIDISEHNCEIAAKRMSQSVMALA